VAERPSLRDDPAVERASMNATRLLCILGLLGSVAGCAGATEDPFEISVGRIEGTDAVVGRVADGQKVTFYVCGGPASYGTLTRWFSGDDDASGSIWLEKGGWQITGDPGGHSGALLSPDGKTLRWSTHAAREGTAEGLYAVADSGCRTGAVVLQPEGAAAPVVQGAWCSDKDQFAQVTPVIPAEISREGLAVRVGLPGVVKTLFVQPVRPE
jgi:hypothetical protein